MTDVPLRDYLEAKLDSIESQIDKTASELERRLESMNEFRSQIQSERSEYVRRETIDMFIKAMSDRLVLIERRLSFIAGGAMAVATVSSALMWFLGKAFQP